MSRIEWSEDFATGINVIDGQHKRIIDYINQLNDMAGNQDSDQLRELLYNLFDYTLSHFTFEESLMEEAGYTGSSIHKKTHDAFRNKIKEYQQRFTAGEDIYNELTKLLNVWLLDHIADDDNSYVPLVKQNMPGLNAGEHEGWLKQKLKSIFG